MARPSLVITGCNGMIAQYVKECFSDYEIHGICRKYVNGTIQCAVFDMNDRERLESYLVSLRPDIIIHLASISNAHEAFDNPIQALQTNGMVTAHLCDIIHRYKWKTRLFNASSSEIFKGHTTYEVTDNDTHMFHLHPYSIAKSMGHSIVDFYRTVHGLPFSNGIIFTTESARRKPTFLLSKVAKHIREWKSGMVPLKLGNLDSYRNIIHASDVARAIRTIVTQDTGNTYVICNDCSFRMLDIVLCMLGLAGIKFEMRESVIYDVSLNVPIIIIQANSGSFEPVPTDIRGIPARLLELGWNPRMNLIQIVSELI